MAAAGERGVGLTASADDCSAAAEKRSASALSSSSLLRRALAALRWAAAASIGESSVGRGGSGPDHRRGDGVGRVEAVEGWREVGPGLRCGYSSASRDWGGAGEEAGEAALRLARRVRGRGTEREEEGSGGVEAVVEADRVTGAAAADWSVMERRGERERRLRLSMGRRRGRYEEEEEEGEGEGSGMEGGDDISPPGHRAEPATAARRKGARASKESLHRRGRDEKPRGSAGWTVRVQVRGCSEGGAGSEASGCAAEER